MCRFISIKSDLCWPEQWHSASLFGYTAEPSLPGTFEKAHFFFWKDNCKMPLLCSVVKNLPARARDTEDMSVSPGSGRSAGGGNGNLLHYFRLENPMDRGAWWATVQGGSQKATHKWARPRAAAIPVSEGHRKRLKPCPPVYRDTHFKSYNCISGQDVTKI